MRGSGARVIDDLVGLPGGVFTMGSTEQIYPDDLESPPRETSIDPFRIGAHAVTNDEFAAFVDATGYFSAAEREGWSFVFAGLLPDDFPDTAASRRAVVACRSTAPTGAHPEGPQSDARRPRRPSGRARLLERRACVLPLGRRAPARPRPSGSTRRAAVSSRRVSRGVTNSSPGGEHRMNVWQGTFPGGNTCADGFAGTGPVDAFPPNGYGLHNMTGNVWEWVRTGSTAVPRADPTARRRRNTVMRGGSYLCHGPTAAATGARPATRTAPTAPRGTSASGSPPFLRWQT